MGKIQILLADDHILFREGLAGILSLQPDMEVVGQAGDGLEAVVLASELKPDLVLMDIQMPGMDGLEATREIKQALPGVIVVILTVREEPQKLFEAIKNGAQGYLVKNIRSREMIEMLRAAAQGDAPISPSMAAKMLDEFRRLSRLVPEDVDEDDICLTARELEVLALAAQGLSDKEASQELCLSLHTIKSHMRNILSKLHASNRHEAARIARRQGLIR